MKSADPNLGERANSGMWKMESDGSWLVGGGFGGVIDLALR